MASFADVRAKYPQYKDMSDQQLAEGLHKKYYSDLSFDEFAQKVGYQAPAPEQPFPDVYAGAGGYNPVLSGLGGGALAGGRALGMTPENTSSDIKNAFAPAETALQLGTGALLTPLAGIAGIGQGLWNKAAPDSMRGPDAADRVRQVQGFAYQPRTGAGAGMSRIAGLPGEVWQGATNKAGEFVTDTTGLPSLGAAIKTVGDVAPGIIGARVMGVERPAPRRTGDYVSTKNEVPTTAQLKADSQRAYKAAEESGVVVPPEGYTKALESIQGMTKKEGLNPTLHPKSTAVLKVLEESSGKPLTLQEAETLRKIALDAEDDMNPVTREATPDARLAGKIVDELDDQIGALSTNSEARSQWARSRRSQMIDRAISRAEIKAGAQYTQAGMEHALRTEFKQLALNDRRMRGLSQAQRDAIKKVASGGPIENTLRALGKFDPTTSVVSAAGSLGTGALLSPLTGGASTLLPVAGYAAKRMATSMTKSNVDAAREALVGRGLSASSQARGTPTPLTAAPRVPAATSAVRTPANIRADMAKLLQKASSIPPNVARDSPQVKALWQEMERLQAELKVVESSAANAPGPVGPQGR